MIPVAFSPPADLLRDLPDHIPAELGVSMWQAGIQDGMNDVHPYTLPEYVELQPLYDRGYATGDRTRAIARMLDSRPGGTKASEVVVEAEDPETRAISHLEKAIRHTGNLANSLTVIALLLLLGLLSLVAVVAGVELWR